MYDVAVVGGGIVGLAIAFELLERRPGTSVLVLEKEESVGSHQTGHNSGVLHSGIYYKPGSLKARIAVRGCREMVRFCEEHGVPYEITGKVIVATREEERPRLEALLERGRENGVPGLRAVTAEELREIEPHARGVAAIHSASTGIVSFRAVAEAMAVACRTRFQTDFALSTVGLAGPGGAMPDKPVGQVYVALAWASGVKSQAFSWLGTRQEIQSRTAKLALNFLRLHLIS